MKLIVLAAALASVVPTMAFAQTLTFDDLPATNQDTPLPQDYHGFDNGNLYYVPADYSALAGTGFAGANHSGRYVGFNGLGLDAVLTSPTSFTFNDGYFTQGFRSVTATIMGYATPDATGTPLFTKTFVTTGTPTLQTFNWTGLRALTFSGGNGEGDHIAFDDLRFNDAVAGVSAVPEPAAWALMIVGFGAVGGAMRRRRRATGHAIA